MKLSERLPSGFALDDGLDASQTEQLMSACRALDLALPLESEHAGRADRERAQRARADRDRQLREALELATSLLGPDRCDVQVLAVTLRLSIEAEGFDGCSEALAVLGRALGEGFGELEASLQQLPERNRSRQRRKWARYFDAVFDQMSLWLAREEQRDRTDLGRRLAESGESWAGWLDAIATGIEQAGLSVSRFESLARWIREGSESARAAAHANAPAPPDASAKADPAMGEGVPSPAHAIEEPPTDTAGADEADRHAPAQPSVPPATSAVLRVSERFWELQRRMSALEQLLARGEFEKAGIVASDLRESIEHFDVAAVFPGLFAPYFEACAEHAGAIASHQPDPRELRTSALASLYRTDLERFLSLRVAARTH